MMVNISPLFTQAGYIRIDGSVPSSERMQLVHKFQSDPETRVAVLSIQAAGQVQAHTYYKVKLVVAFQIKRIINTN